MSAARKAVLFLTLAVLALCSVFLIGEQRVLSLASVLRYGWDSGRYEAAAAGDVYAAAALDGGQIRMVVFSRQGERLEGWSTALSGERGGAVAALYPVSRNLVLAGVYDRNSRHLTLYRVKKDAEAERLLRETCLGTYASVRRNSTRFLGFSRDGDVISFVMVRGNELRAYHCDAGQGGLVQDGEAESPAPRTAAPLPDGGLAVGGDGFLTLDGRAVSAIPPGQLVSDLTRTGAGLYYTDAGSLSLWYCDLTGSYVRIVLDYAAAVSGHTVTDAAPAADGSILLLLDGRTLLQADENGVRALDGVLYPTRAAAAGLLAVGTLAVLFLVLVLWYAFAGRQIPLAAYWGGALAGAVLLSVLLLRFQTLRPAEERITEEKNRVAVESLVRLMRTRYALGDRNLVRELSLALEQTAGFRNVFVTVAYRTEDTWKYADGSRAELDPSFLPDLTAHAWSGADQQEGERFRYCLTEGAAALTVALERTEERQIPVAAPLAVLVLASLLALWALVSINLDVEGLAQEAERLSAGQPVEIGLRTGDELQGLSSTLESLSASMERRNRERAELEAAYRRFVPEQVLDLLGRQSILEVDRETYTGRPMTVMKVRFTFPESVYTDPGRLLFDSVNEVIERTAAIAIRKGGTVFDYDYDGYDVVMEPDAAQAVSAAVAMRQEMLSLNEARARAGVPEAVFRAALDVGNVMVGVVGGSERMEPAMISSSFTTVRTLLKLADRLDAGILCTEAVTGGTEGYGSRYLGRRGGVRVYELYDGDPYDLRRGKAASSRRFSQAVLLLYSGEITAARRIFLDLAHDYPGDGAVRWYLDQADRLESGPDLPRGLDAVSEAG